MVILFEIHQVETGNISAVRDQHKCLERNKVRVELEVGSDFSGLDLGHVALYSFDLFASINCVCGVQCVLNFEYFPSRLHRHKFAPASVDFINHVYDLLDFTCLVPASQIKLGHVCFNANAPNVIKAGSMIIQTVADLVEICIKLDLAPLAQANSSANIFVCYSFRSFKFSIT